MDKIRWTDDKQKVDFVPVFIIGFEEEFERGVIITTAAYTVIAETGRDAALYVIDAAIDMLMQKRDQIEKRELH
jgi:hypothetical protein